MERPAAAAVSELEGYRERARAKDALWPQGCLESERRFGHRAARLYPLVGVHNGVRTPEGIGTLLQAIGGEARVLLLKTKPTLMYRNPDRRVRPMTAFPIERVEPYAPETRRKGAR